VLLKKIRKTEAMSPHNFAQDERSLLCDLFEQTGPEAPTLCEGWTTKDLAAHLVVRERRPDAALGILATPFASHGESVREHIAKGEWAGLISAVRSGPPPLSLFALPGVDRAANTMEYFIHHEDVLRAQPTTVQRHLPLGLQEELWRVLRRMSKVLLRKSSVGVQLVCPDFGQVTANAKHPSVTLTATASELALFAYGRQRAARVEIGGSQSGIAAISSAKLGI
jgi:uncharacterized protein (TIGR03085 family)